MKSPLSVLVVVMGICTIGKADEPVFNIPKIDGVTIDGKGGDWREKGFRVESLAGDSGMVRELKDFDARFRLGWDEGGLLVFVTVTDDQISEADEPDRLHLGDSVEMFLADRKGSSQFFQLLAGTGADPKYPTLRTFVNDRRKPLPAQKIVVETAATRTLDGYLLEARLPWNSLGIKPKMGIEVAFQLSVNDVDSGPRMALAWFPGPLNSSKAMYSLRLGAKASPPMRMAVSRSLDQGRSRLDIVAPPDLLGKKLTALADGNIFATSTFEAVSGRARATVLVPPRKIEISSASNDVLSIDCSDLSESVATAVANAQVIFRPSVFNEGKFPACSFENSADTEKALGKCVFSTTFFDAEYHEVKTASAPGRYGAIVRVKLENGVTFKRFVTLFCTSKDLTWKLAEIHLQSIQFPPELQLDPAVVTEQAKNEEAFFTDQLRGLGFNHGAEPAVLLAGLSGLKATGQKATFRTGPVPFDQQWWYGLKKQTGDLRSDYYLHLPGGYESDPQKKWPLILFLHGSGERGYDINQVKKNGLVRDLEAKPDFPCIVVAPQCSPKEWWSPSELNNLLDQVEAKYRVDLDRVYLTGLSMGGYGSWALATESPQRFAAVVPVCGGGDPDDVERIKGVPIWVFHGGKDEVVPLQRSQKMVDALKKIGGNVKFTIFPEAGHDSWTQAYALPELYEWMLQQRRPQTGTNQ